MSSWKNILRDAGYLGVGAAAVIIEAGGKAVSALIRKGEETLRDNQDTVDDLKRKAKDLGTKVKDAVEKAAAKPEKPPVDTSALSPEERAELRRQLDEADAACETAEAESRPVAPDVIYHADAPIPAEAPEADESAESAEDAPEDEDPING